jgi:hypothetical protein
MKIFKLFHICRWLWKNNLIEEFDSAIQRPDAYVRVTTGISGWHWEDRLKEECIKRNLVCEDPESQVLPWDLKINNHRIQCKSTTYTARVDIRSKKSANKRRYSVEDFDVLALRILAPSGNSYYFVPVRELIDRENILRGGFRLEEYSHCKDNWKILRP